MEGIIQAHAAVLQAITDGNDTAEASAAFNAAVEAQAIAHSEEVDALNTRLTEQEEAATAHSEEAEALNTSITELTTRAETAEEQVTTITTERDGLNTQLEEANTQNETLTARNEELTAMLEDDPDDLKAKKTLDETLVGVNDPRERARLRIERHRKQVEQN